MITVAVHIRFNGIILICDIAGNGQGCAGIGTVLILQKAHIVTAVPQ